MQTLTVTRTIPASVEEVFEAYTDHEKLAEIPGVRSCNLTRRGDTEKNGLGAVREVDIGPIWLEEEIVGFDRPHRMEYRIRKSRPAADHQLGRVEFAEAAGGTKVTWTTRFGVRAPVGGRLLDSAFGFGFGIAFRLALRNVEQRAMAARGGR